MVFIYKDFTPYEKHLKAKEDRRLREWKRDKIAMNEYRRMKEKEYQQIDEIVLMGFCTSICVISNALYLRGLMPNTKITVLEDLCACIGEVSHNAALIVMTNCQIDVENSEEFLKNVL